MKRSLISPRAAEADGFEACLDAAASCFAWFDRSAALPIGLETAAERGTVEHEPEVGDFAFYRRAEPGSEQIR